MHCSSAERKKLIAKRPAEAKQKTPTKQQAEKE